MYDYPIKQEKHSQNRLKQTYQVDFFHHRNWERENNGMELQKIKESLLHK